MRFVHYHIFKNAGSSVTRALQEVFGDAWSSWEGLSPADAKPAAWVSEFLDSRPDVKAFCTHHGRPPLPADCVPIAFLRNPIERSHSVYRFLRLTNNPDHPHITNQSFAEWIDWALETPYGVVIRDYQTLHLSKASFGPGGVLQARATAADLDEARTLIAEWPAIGIVADFEASIANFNERYREWLPAPLPSYRENVTRSDSSSEEERIEEVRRQLGSHLFERLVEANRFDLLLYQDIAAKVSSRTYR